MGAFQISGHSLHSVFETPILLLMWMGWEQNLDQTLSPGECECLSCGGLRAERRHEIGQN